MENGKYRLKDKFKSDSDVEIEISVKGDTATCTKVENNYFWCVGGEVSTGSLSHYLWERIPDEEGTPTFNLGDKVKRKNGTPFSNGSYVVTVDDATCDAMVWLKETGTHVPSKSLELVQISPEQPTPTPHKYVDVIKAWADGYEVQCYNTFIQDWIDMNTPIFTCEYEWRVKPNQDRILEIEKTITELQNELEELKRS